MRGIRIAVVVAGAAAALAAGSAGSSAAPAAKGQACGLPVYPTGPEVVLGRVKTQAAADRLRAQAVREGFSIASIERDCTTFRVVLRGFDTWDIGVSLQAEARRGFPATLECYRAVDKLGELEVVVGHGRDRAAADALAAQAGSEGFRNVKLEADACGGYEVYVAGAADAAQANALGDEVHGAGFQGTVEQS